MVECHLLTPFDDYEKTKIHRSCVIALQIASYLKLAYLIKWYNLVITIEIVVRLAKLGAPFRGHGEDDHLKIKDILYLI